MCDGRSGQSIMVWGAIGINHKAGAVIIQNIDPGRGNGVTALRYMSQVLRFHFVSYFGRHQHHMFQQDNARAHTPRANRDVPQQHNIRIMPWPVLTPDLNPIRVLVGRNPKKTQLNVTKADNLSRSEYSFSQNMGRDSNGLYQPPYSLQDMRVCSQRSWGTYEVLIRNTPTDACDAICTSGNYEETFSSFG